MSKRIELEQISETEVEVFLPPETPMEMVQQLTKGLADRGLVEDLSKSTLSLRYFYRPADKANDIADKLIKSLQSLAKDDLPYWHPKSQMQMQTKNREMDIAERRANLGVKAPSNVTSAPEPNLSSPTPSIKPIAPPAGNMNSATPMYDKTPAAMQTAGFTGKRYGAIGQVGKADDEDVHPDGCRCEDCKDMNKSNYGPKGAGQYTAVDNARRKANNVGDVVGQGPNTNVKAYSTKPGQLSNKASADLTARIQSKANKKQPVKIFTPEEIAAAYPDKVKKSWGQHLPFPNAEEEMFKHSYHVQQGDEVAANQLASMMHSKAMFSNHRQPSKAEFDAAGEAMGLTVSEEMAKSAEQNWHGAINNWMAEATKPISSRFSSEAEELAYWKSIKVAGSGRDEDDSQY